MPFEKIENLEMEKCIDPESIFPRELVRWMKAEWEAAGIETVFPTSSSLAILIITLHIQQLFKLFWSWPCNDQQLCPRLSQFFQISVPNNFDHVHF